MQKEDVIKILSVIKVAYPNFYKELKKDDAEMAIGLWCQMFADDNPAIVTEAVKALICTSKYPPSIADIKEKISLLITPEQMTEMEAWSLIKRKISYYNPTENFATLPLLLQKLVGSPNQLKEWAIMDIDELETVVKSNFLRSYTAKVKREQQLISMPESTKTIINGLNANLALKKSDI